MIRLKSSLGSVGMVFVVLVVLALTGFWVFTFFLTSAEQPSRAARGDACGSSMNAYLQPPHIQIGFYWHNQRNPESYEKVLRLLLSMGYRLSPEVVLMKAETGELPRFCQLAEHDLPEESVRVVTNWCVEQASGLAGWFPVDARLLPGSDCDVEFDLGYTLIFGESYRRGEHHAVEIVASDADSNLLENVGESELDAEIVKRARRTDRWIPRIMRTVCKKLDPDYAGVFWEDELQPPTSFVKTSFIMPSLFYVSSNVAPSEQLQEGLASISHWKLTALGNGTLIEVSRRPGLDADQPGVDVLKESVKRAFLAG